MIPLRDDIPNHQTPFVNYLVIGLCSLAFLAPPIFLGLWFAMQIFSGIGSLSGGATAGVAWWAHAGGFAAGMLAALIGKRTPMSNPPVTQRRF